MASKNKDIIGCVGSSESIVIPEELKKELDEIARKNNRQTKWTDEQVKVLEYYYGKTSINGCVAILQKAFPDKKFTHSSVACKAHTLRK